MIPLVTSREALALDARIQASWAMDPALLMEEAASACFRVLRSTLEAEGRLREGRPRLLALAGGGSNGGDALAILRKASFAGWPCQGAILATEKPGPAAAAQAAMLRAGGIPLISWGKDAASAREALAEADIIVDGLCGAGLAGGLRGSALSLAEAAAAAAKPVAAVDVPSGLGEALSAESFILPATWTLSLEPRKAALYAPALRPRAGRILPVEGVFPLDAPKELLGRLLEEADLASLLPPEDPDAFKGKRGRLGVLAGSPSYAGAAALALRGALSAGAGYISYFAGPSLYAQLSSQGGAAIGASAGTVIKRESELEASLASLDALLVGPGWLPGEEGRALLGRLLDRGMPALLDAGAIRLLPGLLDRGFKASAPLILTPHPGEFAPLSGLGAESFLAEPAGPLRDCARRSGAMLVVKASVSWMAHPEGEIAVFEGREASLGIAGSGDVLAGLGAGLLAREAGAAGAWKALRATVLAHGIAGRRLRRRLGWYEAEALAREAAALLGGIDHGPAA